MAEKGVEVLTLQDDFYRDGFSRVVLVILGFCLAIALLVLAVIYLHIQKPKPITFKVGDEWRVLQSVSVDQPYVSNGDLLQWVANVVLTSFNYDFINYNDQLRAHSQYFTQNGWKVFLNQLNNYANYNTIQTNHLFVNGAPAGAPIIYGQKVSVGRYEWVVQVPVNITYAGGVSTPLPITLNLQLTVVRVPTENNLAGIGIENVIVLNANSSFQTGGG